jgi:hypothetical protein
MNWRGRPLTSHQFIVNTIAATTTRTGLTVRAELDPGSYPAGVKVSDEQMAALPMDRHDWHGDWNYTLHPRPRPATATTMPPPAAAPARPAPARASQDALAHPALTGMTRPELDALAAAIALPWAAQQEARRYTKRGAPRSHARRTGLPSRLDLTDHLLATLLHHRLGLRQDAIGRLLGIDQASISRAITLTRPLLAQHGTTIKTAARLRTLDELRQHAIAAGITLQIEPAR